MTDHNICRRVRLSPYRKGMGPTFTLTMWDNVGYDSMGKTKIRYELRQHLDGKTTILFSAADFATPQASDSDETVGALLGFLTLRPGDTDAEYFAEYTPEQLAFAETHAEQLSVEIACRFCPELRAKKTKFPSIADVAHDLRAVNAEMLPSRLPDGTLPAFTSAGCYPLVYLTKRGNVLCAKCATANDDSDDPTTSGDIHWEGAPLDCDQCSWGIESAYGEVR